MFYLADKTEDVSSEGRLPRGKGGARIYRGFCNKGQVVGTSKDYC